MAADAVDRTGAGHARAVAERAIRSIFIPSRAVALVVSGIALVLYALTALRGVSFGDSAEAQSVPYLLGILHPTGYPTYTLLQWAFDLLPLGSVAWRANLFSAVCASAGLGVITLAMGHLGVRPVVAALSAAVLGAVAAVWSYATVADVHALHFLFLALLLHRTLLWAESRRARDLYLGALLIGLAAGNHMLTATQAPFFAVAVLWFGRAEPRALLRRLPLAALFLLAGLAVYAYLPLRGLAHPPFAYGDTTTLEGLRAIVTGSEFTPSGRLTGPEAPARFVAALPGWLGLLAAQSTFLFPLLSAAGIVLLLRARPAFAVFALALVLSNVYVYANYFDATLPEYLYASWLVLALAFAVACEGVARRLPQLSRAVATTALAVLSLWLVISAFPASDRSRDRSGEEFLGQIDAQLPAGAAIITYWDTATPLRHLQLVELRRTDLLVLTDTSRVDRLVRERPVYLLELFDSAVQPLRGRHRLTPVATVKLPYGGLQPQYDGQLLRVEPAGGAVAPSATGRISGS